MRQYHSIESPVPFRRARLANRRIVRRPVPKLRAMPARRRGFYDITGTVGRPERLRLRLGPSPRFVLPYPEPGLGELWDAHLEDQQLAGVFKKIKKAARKVVKSKAFKYAAIGTAAYFTGGMALKYAPQIMSAVQRFKGAIPRGAPAPQAGQVSEQPQLPPGYYWDAAGYVHDQAGNVYDQAGNLVAAAPGAGQPIYPMGGAYEAASTVDPGGAIPGEFYRPRYAAAGAGGFDVGALLKIGVPVAIVLVLLNAGRRRR